MVEKECSSFRLSAASNMSIELQDKKVFYSKIEHDIFSDSFLGCFESLCVFTK